jgi:hypothetical protein
MTESGFHSRHPCKARQAGAEEAATVASGQTRTDRAIEDAPEGITVSGFF